MEGAREPLHPSKLGRAGPGTSGPGGSPPGRRVQKVHQTLPCDSLLMGLWVYESHQILSCDQKVDEEKEYVLIHISLPPSPGVYSQEQFRESLWKKKKKREPLHVADVDSPPDPPHKFSSSRLSVLAPAQPLLFISPSQPLWLFSEKGPPAQPERQPIW